jgi:hypothetical protein
MNQYLIGILFGGILISTLGAISTYNLENKKPTTKSLIRDFIIGSILFVLVMQLLPESSISLITALTSFVTSSVIPTSVDDIEIQVGVPKF